MLSFKTLTWDGVGEVLKRSGRNFVIIWEGSFASKKTKPCKGSKQRFSFLLGCQNGGGKTLEIKNNIYIYTLKI